jgi:hypothetical protein
VAILVSNKKIQTGIAALKTSTRAVRHTLDLSGPHRFVFHEHGILVLVPLAPGRTFCHDISNCVDDPWDPLIKKALETDTLKSRWIWYDIEPDAGKSHRLQHLTLEGPALDVGEEYEDLEPVAEIMGDELYPDDYVAKIDYDHLTARLTHLQNTEKLNKKPPS